MGSGKWFSNEFTTFLLKPGVIPKPFGCNPHANLYPGRMWGARIMLDGIYNEETALRRRLLFRLLRDFNFDEPQYRGEAISDPVPKALITNDYLRYDRGQTVSNHCQL